MLVVIDVVVVGIFATIATIAAAATTVVVVVVVGFLILHTVDRLMNVTTF